MVQSRRLQPTTTDVVEIPIDEIKVNRRMRRTDEERIKDLAESIKNVGLLHHISIAIKNGGYVLLSGLHRLEAFRILGRSTIATVRESNEHIDQLIEVEENLVRSELNAIQTAEHIIKREELLIALGKKAVARKQYYGRQDHQRRSCSANGVHQTNLPIQKISCQSQSRSKGFVGRN